MQPATSDQAEILRDQDTLDEGAPQMGKYDEDAAQRQVIAESDRGDRIALLDEAITEKKEKLEELTRQLHDTQAIQDEQNKEYTQRRKQLDGEIKEKQATIKQHEIELAKREKSLDRRESILNRDREKLHDERDEIKEEIDTLTEQLTELQGDAEATAVALMDDLAKQKRLDRDYTEAQDLYAKQIAKRIERRDTLDREIETLESERKAMDQEAKARTKEFADRERLLKAREIEVAKQEKIVDDMDRMVADKYATLERAINEWRAKGVTMPKDTQPKK